MFRVIVADDEKRALDRFERIAGEDDRISVIGRFGSAGDALEFIGQNQVDIAFLDIDMPVISGLELAKRLNKVSPMTKVVFITAYDSFALDAFQARAIGYLLKPLNITDIRNLMDSIVQKFSPLPETAVPDKLTVKCFGKFICYA